MHINLYIVVDDKPSPQSLSFYEFCLTDFMKKSESYYSVNL